MKITEVIIEAGRPVQFYPSLAKVFGIEEAIFIGQLLYWKGKEEDKRGIRKSIGEIESETSLSAKQQNRIKKKLQKQGCLEYEYDRTNHKSYYQIFANKINEIYQGYSPKGHIPKGSEVYAQRDVGIVPKGVSSITESTTENTTESMKAPPSSKKILTKEEIQKITFSLFSLFKKEINNKARMTPQSKIKAEAKMKARLKNFTIEGLEQAIINFSQDKWKMENIAYKSFTWFLEKDSRIEDYINLSVNK